MNSKSIAENEDVEIYCRIYRNGYKYVFTKVKLKNDKIRAYKEMHDNVFYCLINANLSETDIENAKNYLLSNTYPKDILMD